jgi:hypothetical protein
MFSRCVDRIDQGRIGGIGIPPAIVPFRGRHSPEPTHQGRYFRVVANSRSGQVVHNTTERSKFRSAENPSLCQPNATAVPESCLPTITRYR